MGLRVVHLFVQKKGEEYQQRLEEECANWDPSIPIVRFIRPDGSVEEFNADLSPLLVDAEKEADSQEIAIAANELAVETEELQMARNQSLVDPTSSEALTIPLLNGEGVQPQEVETQSRDSQPENPDTYDLPDSVAERVANIEEMCAESIEELMEDMVEIENLRALREEASTMAKRLAGLERADSAPRCAHVRANGETCGSPAMKRDPFCYFHSEARKMRNAAEAAAKLAEMPILEDRQGLQLAIMRVCTLLADNKIEERTARAIFDGLRLAQKTLNENPV